MRSLLPSGKAPLYAGAIALALVVAGGTGAVAGQMITSDDIKNQTIQSKDLADDSVRRRNIAPGAVSWNKSLSDAAKAQIEALVQAGPPGPQGIPGADGDDGDDGADGQDGANGDGSLVAFDYYGFDGYSAPDPDTDLVQLEGHDSDTIELTEGNYLVSAQALFVDTVEPLLFFGEIQFEEAFPLNEFLNACVLGEFDFFPRCDSNFPLSVPEGEVVSLPVSSPPVDEECELDEVECTPALVRVAVYAMGGAVPETTELPEFDGCGFICRPDVRKGAKRFLRYLS